MSKSQHFILTILTLVFLTSCAISHLNHPLVNNQQIKERTQAIEKLNQVVKFKMTAEQVQQCQSLGGEVTILGLMQFDFCSINYNDSENICSDGNQCQSGVCLAPQSGVPVNKPNQKGTCAASNIRFGCHQLISKGIATEPMICVD